MDLISDEYRAQQAKLHEDDHYGVAGMMYAPLVTQLINKLEVSHLLDYGCGHNLSLGTAIKPDHALKYQAYDPAIERFASPPVPAEMVCCIDVLEHIEPNLIDNVLDDLMRVTEAIAFVTVCTSPAKKILSDGRNAHLIVEPAEWWLPRLMARFDLQTFQVTTPNSFYCVLYARGSIETPTGEKAN